MIFQPDIIEVEHHPHAGTEDLDTLHMAVEIRFAETLFVAAQIRILAPGTIGRIEAGKAQRIYDNRKQLT